TGLPAMAAKRLRGETFLSTSPCRLALAALVGAGTVTAALPARAVDVATEAQLRTAISSRQSTITFTAHITLTDNLPPLTADSTVNGANHTLSGASLYRGLTVQFARVSINDLTIANARAQGGKGGDGFGKGGTVGTGSGGGGGAGLGAALFISDLSF